MPFIKKDPIARFEVDMTVTGQVIDKRRQDRRKPPTGVLLQMRLNEVDELFQRVMTLMDGCPEALKLDSEDNPSVA